MYANDFNVRSTDGTHTLKGIVFEPEGAPRGIIHIVHGMAEHIERYEKTMRELSQAGWIVAGYDHLGHGFTALNDSELGFIAPKNGWKYLVDDVEAFREALLEKYGRHLQYVLFGHSMGSFIVRLAATEHTAPDKLIVMGTGGPNPAAGVGGVLAGAIKTVRGKKHVSPFFEGIAFKGYNDRFKDEPDGDNYSWLSTQKSTRVKYIADKFCGFHFTISALQDLVKLNAKSNSAAWFRAFPKSLPVLLTSGSEDPVGNYGEGVKQVRDGLVNAGVKNVSMKIYDGARHEILNDFTHDRVVADILEFIN